MTIRAARSLRDALRSSSRDRRDRCCRTESHATGTTRIASHRGACWDLCHVPKSESDRHFAWCRPTRLMVCADDEQAGVLALGAGIRLQGNRSETGDLCQPPLQLPRRAHDIPRPGRGAQRVNVRQPCPRSPEAFPPRRSSFIVQEPSGIIDVVSERSRDSRRADVTQEFRLRMITVKDRMIKKLRLAP